MVRCGIVLALAAVFMPSPASSQSFDDRIAKSDAVFTGRVLSVGASTACSLPGKYTHEAIVEINDLLVGDTRKITKVMKAQIAHSSASADDALRTLQSQRFLFYADLRSVREGMVELTSLPCGIEPQNLATVPAAMRVIAECYGSTGPNETRLPTRKCK